ncbi:MAG: twin-arginine translocase subunit TatC, partial [Cyanobacteria bacterium P01_C01_bin.121]
MTPPSDLETAPSPNLSLLDEQTDEQSRKAYLDELPNDVEMSLFDHLDELRQRIFYALIAVLVGVIACFTEVRRIVELLEIPAQGAKFLQLSPGEY